MNMNIIILAGVGISLLFSVLSFIMATITLIKVIASEKASHTVQLVPVDEEVDRANQEYMKQWASSEEAISKERNMYKEDREESMPEFSSEQDEEIFSL